LHAIEAGPASKSYGVQVARLAGMPQTVLRQARTTLAALESQARTGQAQIDLFASPATVPETFPETVPEITPTNAPALDALIELDPDLLTPREALDALYRLKALLS
ncbi:MAG: DNA mismatch repair protein MutS, partial [Leptothrix ochracea]